VPAFLLGLSAALLPAAAKDNFRRVFFTIACNKPLMVCTGHWKSSPVLPMFPRHYWRPIPALPEDARLNAMQLNASKQSQRAWKCRYG
jgi:hypothetical protein